MLHGNGIDYLLIFTIALSDISSSAAISGRADDGCNRFGITSTTNTLCVAPGETVTITCSASLGYTIHAWSKWSTDRGHHCHFV